MEASKGQIANKIRPFYDGLSHYWFIFSKLHHFSIRIFSLLLDRNNLDFQMQNSKLIHSLQILSRKELKRLYQFLKSPFYNSNHNIVECYLLLRKYYPAFDSPKISKEKVFKKLFPSSAYDHQKMLNLMSDFNRLIEKYLTVIQLEKEELEQKKLLLRAFAERPDCYDGFEKQFNAVNQLLDNLPYRDDVFYHHKKELNLLYYGHPNTNRQTGNNTSLEAAFENFEAHRKISEIKLKCALNAKYYGMKNHDQPIGIVDFNISENLVHQLYSKLVILQNKKVQKEYSKEITGLFIANIEQLRAIDQHNILIILLNWCSRYIHQGQIHLIPVSLELYKAGLANHCILVEGKMTETTFQNIIAAGLHCDELNWTIEFMKAYEEKLDVGVRADAVAMGKAQWHFKKGEFLTTTQILQYAFSKPQNIFKAKSLLIRAWFELFWRDDSYLDLLLNQLDAFEKYIRRDKSMPDRLLKGYLKFVNFTRKLINKKWEKNTHKQLIEDIHSESNLILKNWLLEKIQKKGAFK